MQNRLVDTQASLENKITSALRRAQRGKGHPKLPWPFVLLTAVWVIYYPQPEAPFPQGLIRYQRRRPAPYRAAR